MSSIPGKYPPHEKISQHSRQPDPRAHLMLMALLSRPGIESQLDEAVSLIEGISSTIRSLRRGLDSLHVGMREAQQQMYRLPYKAAGPKKTQHTNSSQQSQHIDYNNPPAQEEVDQS